MNERLQRVLDRIDRFNSEDPNTETVDGVAFPRELVYSKRLTDWVLRLEPEASEALRIAARGQHIGRWTLPRDSQPGDRGGYLRWRETLKRFHADKVAEIMAEEGYTPDEIAPVRSVILKKNLKTDPAAQTLEDGLCLVFLEFQIDALIRKTPHEKMVEIVRKTWGKMGQRGRAAALKIPLSPAAKSVVSEALETP